MLSALIGGLGLWPGLQRARATARSMGIAMLLRRHSAPASASYHTRYRIHAAVTLFSLPIFSRQDVGGGYVTVEKSHSEESSIVALQLAAGSWPDRTKGLNRFGAIQEVIVEHKGDILESAFVGFMTSSNEHNLDQARKALAEVPNSIPCTLAHGISTPTELRVSMEKFALPPREIWKDAASLLHTMREQDTPSAEERPEPARAARPTFLYAVRRAMRSQNTNELQTFLHNGKLYDLQTNRNHEGEDFSSMSGAIRTPGGSRLSQFVVWFRKGDESGIPARIEFRPRSFLRLTFETAAASGEPVIQFMLTKDQA